VRTAKAVIWSAVGLAVVVALVVGVVVIWSGLTKTPLPIADRCEATVKGRTTTIDPEQARNAAIIAGVSVKRDLAPRAASIALTTAYQESGIRNLDYGHADSLGLFQQRPSKGWGTKEQVMDPWYSSTAFYKAMVKVKKWEAKDIGDVAQAVQRSAYPDAYDKHIDNARTLASALTGQTPASFSCVVKSPAAADPAGMSAFLTKTLGDVVDVSVTETGLQVETKTSRQAWAVAHLAIANVGGYGLASVQLGPSTWTHSATGLATWQGNAPTETTEVQLIFPSPTASPR
jgi:hypothetical protein